ncbi:conserved hypothetical protein [Brochothrix thermosphacta]|nr:conserved hypothetical protein [Brochothrix thermosphacta]
MVSHKNLLLVTILVVCQFNKGTFLLVSFEIRRKCLLLYLELSQLTFEQIDFKQLRNFKLYLTKTFENAITVNMHLARMRFFLTF